MKVAGHGPRPDTASLVTKSAGLPLSLVITTFNNSKTLESCIKSAPFAEEILVLDSFSSDGSEALASRLGARVVQEAFRGYGPQKQRAIELAKYDSILLLDADEALSPALADEVSSLLNTHDPIPLCRLLREEWLYWRWPVRGTRLTDHLRLFDRREVSMSRHPVHAAVKTQSRTRTLNGRLRHFGHQDIAGQIARINAYTTESVLANPHRGPFSTNLKLLLSPGAAFIREYFLRRQFLNGWAGFIAARLAAMHAFLRHAKRLESVRRKD